MTPRRVAGALRVCIVAVCTLTLASAAAADGAADRPITLVVANPAGGATDQLARELAEALGKRLERSVIVTNVGGASGAIGAKRVLRAPPDGHTLLLGTTTDMILTPLSNQGAGYRPGDFTPIAMIATTPMALVARTALGIRSVHELVTHVQRGERFTLGYSGGTSSLAAYAAAAFMRAAHVDLVDVPYKGGAQLLTDLIGGQVDLAITSLPGVLDHARSGHLAMLGILSQGRSAAAPDMPTVEESGAVEGLSIEIWAALAGPPKVPAGIVDRINQAVQEVLSDSAFRHRLGHHGGVISPPAPAAAVSDFMVEEERRYRVLAARRVR
jgi:tripartite-type tricarboxylate transporter receptor subunit TctC